MESSVRLGYAYAPTTHCQFHQQQDIVILARLRHDMIHPIFCYLGIAFSFALSLTLFVSGTLDERTFFYLPIVLLIAFYTVHAVVTDKQTYHKRSFKQSILTATGKYLLWGFILLAIIGLYQFHPGYRAMTTNTRLFFEHFFYAFAVCGWPYFFLADKFRYCPTNVMVDHYITIAVLLRCLKRKRFQLFKRRLATRQTKRMLISAALRVHFIPVMFEQVYFGVTALTLQAQIQPYSMVLMLTTLAWLIDSNNAGIGYFWESPFTKTCFRAMDPHPSHWIVTLACYIPFIYCVNAFVVLFPTLPEDSQRVFSQAGVNSAIDIVMVTVLLLYMASGSALAFSFSNLSYKKIQTKGLYHIIRHPAITFKVIWFTLAFYRFAPAYSIDWLLCYVSWMAIYICRAFVEERFLRRFPDYQAYMQKTKYRFIPGVV